MGPDGPGSEANQATAGCLTPGRDPRLLHVPLCGMAVAHGAGGHTAEPHRAAPRPTVKRPHTWMDTGTERGDPQHGAQWGLVPTETGRRHTMEAWERLEGFRKAATAGL